VLVAVAVLLGLAALLAVPVELAFRVAGPEAASGSLAVGWLFGLVRHSVRYPRPDPPRPRRRRRRRARAREGRRASSGRRALDVLRQEPFRRRAWRLARDLARALRPRDLRLRLRLGLGDPADTGRLWGLLGPLAAVAGATPLAEVRLEPEFLEPALELEASGRVRVVPLRLLALAAGFALSPSTLRALGTLRGGRG
jgi:hypothetical protein